MTDENHHFHSPIQTPSGAPNRSNIRERSISKEARTKSATTVRDKPGLSGAPLSAFDNSLWETAANAMDVPRPDVN